MVTERLAYIVILQHLFTKRIIWANGLWP